MESGAIGGRRFHLRHDIRHAREVDEHLCDLVEVLNIKATRNHGLVVALQDSGREFPAGPDTCKNITAAHKPKILIHDPRLLSIHARFWWVFSVFGVVHLVADPALATLSPNILHSAIPVCLYSSLMWTITRIIFEHLAKRRTQ